MPFGMQNSTGTFQRLVDIVLEGCQSYARAYVDDIVVYSGTWSEHLRHLEEVLTKLGKAGLTVKPKKCSLFGKQVVFLGHFVGGGETRPNPEKIEDVRDYPTPVTKKNVKGFLGLTGYYRSYIANYSETADPLFKLLKKNQPNKVSWNEECEQAFSTLKNALTREPVLRSPDFKKEFIVQTDASNVGIGGILAQLDDEGGEHPVAYYSRRLSDREQKYSTNEKECLAVISALRKWNVYLLGTQFRVETDNRALQWLQKHKSTNPRLERWSLALQPYSFEIVYRKGVLNQNADALSRM
jgi:hypothetical protein